MTRNWTNRNSYGCEHVRPRDDWGESVEQWLSSMLAIGRTPETLRTRWYQIARFSRIVDRPIDQVDADAVIAFFLQSSMDLEVKRNARACVKVFYQWAVAHRIADHNPIDEVPVIPTRPRGWLICPEHAINEGLKSQDEDAVLAVMQQCPAHSAPEARAWAAGQLLQFQLAAQRALAAQGIRAPVRVYLVNMYFPARRYPTGQLPAGRYDAVRIDIGSGGGRNWWCVLYPGLCSFAQGGYALPAENDLVCGQYILRFRLVDWAHRLTARRQTVPLAG